MCVSETQYRIFHPHSTVSPHKPGLFCVQIWRKFICPGSPSNIEDFYSRNEGIGFVAKGVPVSLRRFGNDFHAHFPTPHEGQPMLPNELGGFECNWPLRKGYSLAEALVWQYDPIWESEKVLFKTIINFEQNRCVYWKSTIPNKVVTRTIKNRMIHTYVYLSCL